MHSAASIGLKTRVQAAVEQDFWHEWLQLGTLCESNGAGSEEFGAQLKGNQAPARQAATKVTFTRAEPETIALSSRSDGHNTHTVADKKKKGSGSTIPRSARVHVAAFCNVRKTSADVRGTEAAY